MSTEEKFVYHTTTRNTAFLQMHKTLKKNGIKNNKFFLRLYDKKLLRVDPFAKNLSPENKGRILKEIRRNPWYYYREVVRVLVPGGTKRFAIHRGNLALLWCIHNNINHAIELPRQHFKTISTVCAFSWIYCFGTTETQMLFSNKELGDSQLNVKRLKDIISKLPRWMDFRDPVNDTDNVMRIHSKESNNEIKAISTAKDVEAADKLGRGLTAPCLWFDEFAFLKFNQVIYESAAPAQGQAMIEAAAKGMPYFKSISTTPNNIDVESGAFCKELIDDSAKFIDAMYDWPMERVREYIDKESTNDFVHIIYSYKELGRSEDWFRTQCRALQNKADKIKREILLEWTRTSDASVFDEEDIDAADSHVLPVLSTVQIRNVYNIHFVERPQLNYPYILGIDVAAGLSKDSSTIVIEDPFKEGDPIGWFESSKIDTDDFFHLICDLMEQLFGSAILAIERNNVGIALIQRLAKTKWEKNLYFYYAENTDKKKIQSALKKTTGATKTKIYGVNTTSQSREEMMELLQETILNRPEAFRLKPIVDQIATLERNSKGKIEHAANCHDDVLFGYLIGRYALAQPHAIARFLRRGKSPNGAANKASSFNQIANMNKKDNVALSIDTSQESQPRKLKVSGGLSAILNLNNM